MILRAITNDNESMSIEIEKKKLEVRKVRGQRQKKMRDIERAERFVMEPLDKEILKLMIEFPLITVSEIAATLRVPIEDVARRRKSKLIKTRYAELTASTEEHLKIAARKAAMRLATLVQDADKQIALAAIKIALAPYINRADINVNMKSAIVFKSTVTPDGNLIQEVYEQQRAALTEASYGKEQSEGSGYDRTDGQIIEADSVVKD